MIKYYNQTLAYIDINLGKSWFLWKLLGYVTNVGYKPEKIHVFHLEVQKMLEHT
jgi:hypothetical protein